MAKKVFHHLDEAAFKGIDNLKSQPQFSQASSALESLSDEAQKWINQGLTYLISFCPLIIFLVVLVMASMTRSKTDTRADLIESIGELNSANREMATLGGSLVGRTTISNQGALESILKQFESSYAVTPNSLKVINFSQKNHGDLIEVNATMVFQGLSTPKMGALLEMLSVRENSKISNISLKKNKETLEGEISFIHYSRGAQPVDEASK